MIVTCYAFSLPDEKHIALTLKCLSYRAAKVPLAVFNVSFLVKDLYKVEVAIVGLLEFVVGELDVDLLALLCPDDPSAVQGCSPLLGMRQMLLGDIGSS